MEYLEQVVTRSPEKDYGLETKGLAKGTVSSHQRIGDHLGRVARKKSGSGGQA